MSNDAFSALGWIIGNYLLAGVGGLGAALVWAGMVWITLTGFTFQNEVALVVGFLACGFGGIALVEFVHDMFGHKIPPKSNPFDQVGRARFLAASAGGTLACMATVFIHNMMIGTVTYPGISFSSALIIIFATGIGIWEAGRYYVPYE